MSTSLIVLYDKDCEFEDSLFNLEHDHVVRKNQLIRQWAEHLEQFKEKNTISAYIRSRMRLRGWTEGQLDHIGRALGPEYTDQKFNTYQQRGDAAASLLLETPRPDIYRQFEEIAQNIRVKSDMAKLSDAELYEIIPIKLGLIREDRRRSSDLLKEIVEVCKERGVEIPELQKESRELPPEYFWGQTEASQEMKGIGYRVIKLGTKIVEVGEGMEKFKATPEVSHKSYVKLHEWRKSTFNKIVQFIEFVWLPNMEDITIHESDAKYRQHLPGWIKIGHDQVVNAGSHGSGMINSVPTGEYIYEASKDGKTIFKTGIKRPFTREIVGDMTQKKLLTKAVHAINENLFSEAFRTYVDETVLEEEPTQTPEQFFEEMKKQQGARRQ